MNADTDLAANTFYSLWLQGVALTLVSISEEFNVSTTQVRYTTCALFIGLCIGAAFWVSQHSIWFLRFVVTSELNGSNVLGYKGR